MGIREENFLYPDRYGYVQLLLNLGEVEKPRPKYNPRIDLHENILSLLRWYGDDDLRSVFNNLVVRNDAEGLKEFRRQHRSELIKIHPKLRRMITELIREIVARRNK